MSQFLHIGFNWSNPPNIAGLETAFYQGIDWLRYSNNCWIVWTNSDANVWYERVRPYMVQQDSVFICRIDMRERQGYLPQWAWEWMNKPR